MNVIKQNNLAILAQKEKSLKLNLAVESYFTSVKDRVNEITDYSEEEKQEIDSFIPYVCNIDDLIKEGQGFANSVQYSMFVLGYDGLSPRVQNHFTEIFKEFKLKYLLEKINKNLTNIGGPKNALNNYFNELQNNYPEFNLQYFYKTFPNAKNLLDKIIKK